MADHGGGSVSGSSRFWCSIPEKLQLHGAMLALQFGYAGFHVVSRAALNMGISKLVFLVYRNIIAFFLLLPFAYFLEKYFYNSFFLSSSSNSFIYYVNLFLLSLFLTEPYSLFYVLSGRNVLPFLSIFFFSSSFLPLLGMSS